MEQYSQMALKHFPCYYYNLTHIHILCVCQYINENTFFFFQAVNAPQAKIPNCNKENEEPLPAVGKKLRKQNASVC